MSVNRMFVSMMWLFLVPLFCQSGEASISAENPVAVCSLAAHPERFAGKIVALTGELNSDGIERVVLTDEHCKDFGVAIMTPEHFRGEDSFVNALQTGHPGTLDKTIRGVFIGKFTLKHGQIPSRVLILKEVRDLVTTMKKSK